MFFVVILFGVTNVNLLPPPHGCRNTKNMSVTILTDLKGCEAENDDRFALLKGWKEPAAKSHVAFAILNAN